MTDLNGNVALCDVKLNLCLICQSRLSGGEELSVLGQDGKNRFFDCANERKKAFDSVYAQAIERVLKFLSTTSCDNVRYHRGCYSTFTSTTKIQALTEKTKSAKKAKTDSSSTSEKYLTRSKTVKYNKTQCIFFQKHKNEKLRKVQSDEMTATVMNLAKYDYMLKLRVDRGDLIAADVLYHSTCVILMKRAKDKIKNELDVDKQSLLFIQICKELRVTGSLEQILTLDDVWKRYVQLCDDMDVEIPQSFQSRRSSFKEKLECEVRSVYQFFQHLDRDIFTRQMLLLPLNKSKKLAADAYLDNGDDIQLPAYDDSDLRTILHAALKIRGEILSWPGHTGLDVSKEAAMKVIPDSLHLFLSILMQGDKVMDTCQESTDENDDKADKEVFEVLSNNVTMSVAQDIVYAVSKGTKQTPKHLGLGITLYRATRSRKLLNLFYAAAHCSSYYNILQSNNALANLSLQGFDQHTGAVIPTNFRHGPCSDSVLHVTADNLDITTDTLSGKTSFHVTQMASFKRNVVDSSYLLRNVKLAKDTTLKVPPELTALAEVDNFSKVDPHLCGPVDPTWFGTSDPLELTNMPETLLKPKMSDIAFAMSRAETGEKVGWSEFQRLNLESTLERSAVGYMPIIMNPAHELSSLCTVLKRSLGVADGLGHKYVVLTVDQALYCKLLEIQWKL